MLILSFFKIKKPRLILKLNIPHYANKVSTQQTEAINRANFTVTVVNHKVFLNEVNNLIELSIFLRMSFIYYQIKLNPEQFFLLSKKKHFFSAWGQWCLDLWNDDVRKSVHFYMLLSLLVSPTDTVVVVLVCVPDIKTHCWWWFITFCTPLDWTCTSTLIILISNHL